MKRIPSFAWKFLATGFLATGLCVGWTFSASANYETIAEVGIGELRAVDADEDVRDLEPAYTIPLLDLAQQTHRQFLVDREPDQYLGHPTTVLLEDGKTLLCVYPKGHGKGPIVLKRSEDGGKSWSERLDVPENWSTSQETPTIHRVVDADGKKRLILFSGLYPIRMSYSEDDGRTWTPLEKIGDFGGIVAMGCVGNVGPGRYFALFHDDGRFIANGKRKEADGNRFHVYQVDSNDGGLTWSEPRIIATHSQADLCEPGLVRSPDGKQLAVLLRENRRKFNSYLITSEDEGQSWSTPRQLPAALTGDRHTAVYADDGRLFISFRDMTRSSPTQGDWVAWVGHYEDLLEGREGQYRVRLMDNHDRFDCAYPGVVKLPDGTIVTTTYGHWEAGEAPYIVSVRLTLEELDRQLQEQTDDTSNATTLDNWPRFRGPQGTGNSTQSFPVTFEQDDFAWDSPLAGTGNGSPVVWGQRIFIQSADRETGKRFLQCLDLSTGKELWQKHSSGDIEHVHAWGSFASCTPAVDQDRVYVAQGSRSETTLSAYDHQGELLWENGLGPSVFTHGYGSSPTLVGDKVIMFDSQQADQLPAGQTPGKSRMLAFSRDAGELLWETPLKATRVCYGVPVEYQSAAGKTWIVAANTGNGVFAVDADNGALLWEKPVVPQRSVASPVIVGEMVLASSGSGGGGNETVAVDLETQQEIFRVTRNANYVPTLVTYDQWAFLPGDKGILSCVELKSGEMVSRKRLGPGAFGISSSPVVADGKLYVISDAGQVKVLEANPELEELGSGELGEPTRATPAIGGGYFLFRTNSHLKALKAN